ncbi:recombinase family protein [Wenxinia marina]|uniref:Recombinase n=1 Tax=Wenxinia marina DSM 24838 TaxID=1123501 RepID=A0A0D0QEI6_9RHOB|nr:recombinase family protein [Wenxinia marina]KIQ69428.1 Recombinase [Wenxinia marina DSM 24838]GGL58270.1 hypothetical protein GCM10011392_10880 [Wenxinia marina]
MGGSLPLGYDRHSVPERRELVVNETEAETVRTLFRLYDKFGSLRELEFEAARLGPRPKMVVYASGRRRGDGPFRRGQLHYLLANPICLGQIRHRDRTWPGQHPAIIDADLLAQVQEKLQAAAGKRRGGTRRRASPAAWLVGRLVDETGDRLTPTHTTKGGRRYRYYVSNRLVGGGPDPAGWRLPAPTLERAVAGAIGRHLVAAAERQAVVTGIPATLLAGIGERTIALGRRPDLPSDWSEQARLLGIPACHPVRCSSPCPP